MKKQVFLKNQVDYIMKAKVNLKNILYYAQGNLRYKLFYSKFAFLIRKHIREQIEIRIKSMDPICYSNGECKECGCETTHLQMCNKACDKSCYPVMLSKEDWGKIKDNGLVWGESNRKTLWGIQNNKFVLKHKIITQHKEYETFESIIDKLPKPKSNLKKSKIKLF